MTGMRLSIVIPVRNGMPYLPAAVESALSQLPDGAEIVIRDNRSTDGTTQWLRSIDDPRVRIVESDTDLSAGENWTAVCREATGEYVKLLCADDFITPGGIDRQLAAAESSGAVMVASRRTVVDSEDRPVIAAHGLRGLIGESAGRRALALSVASGTNAFGEPSSVLWRRDALESALPFTREFPYVTDLDLYARVLGQGTFVGLASVDGGFRLSTTSWSSAVGKGQLREFSEWVRVRTSEGALRMTAMQRAKARLMIPAKYFARRVVNQLITRRQLRRDRA